MMKPSNLRRFAPAGLVLAGLAVLAAVGLYIVQQGFTLPVQISLASIVLGLALFVLLDPQRTREALTGRQARYGSNALLMTIAFVGIVIAVNYLASANSRNWDLTEDQLNSLTPETLQALQSLKTPVKAEAYYRVTTPVESARDLLQNYKTNAGGRFDFEIIDPDTDPIRAQQSNVTRDATIVLKMDGRMEQVNFASEQEITGALIRLANPGTRAVYFLTGHGEYVIDGNAERNYSQLRVTLENKNYTVGTLNLLSDKKIPEDALALIIAGPLKPLSQEEVELIRAYLENGGSLVYMTEPRPVTEFGEQEDPMAAFLKSDWGIEIDEDLVIDLSSNRQVIAISNHFGDHPITRKMASLAVVMPSARTVRVGQVPEGVQLNELVYTSDMAWGETDYQSLQDGQVTQDQGIDIFGPTTLAVAGVNNNSKARVLVAGDSDFAGSQAFTQYGNSDFIMNSIDWAAEQENLINLTAKEPTQRFLAPPQNYAIGLILLGSVFLLPGLVVVTGVSVWLQRRRRG